MCYHFLPLFFEHLNSLDLIIICHLFILQINSFDSQIYQEILDQPIQLSKTICICPSITCPFQKENLDLLYINQNLLDHQVIMILFCLLYFFSFYIFYTCLSILSHLVSIIFQDVFFQESFSDAIQMIIQHRLIFLSEKMMILLAGETQSMTMGELQQHLLSPDYLSHAKSSQEFDEHFQLMNQIDVVQKRKVLENA